MTPPTVEDVQEQARRLVGTLTATGVRVATAESCTGGMIAAFLTDVPGSSAALDRGFVTYSNAAKTEMLAVPARLIEQRGAVSEEVARAMAEGALALSSAGCAVAVTGIAGPGGGTQVKPVGLVHFAVSTPGGTYTDVRRFGEATRAEIRRWSVATAFDLIERVLIDQAAATGSRP